VTATRNARGLIRLDGGHQRRVGRVHGAFFKRSSACMTVEAFTIVERLVQLDLGRFGRFSPGVDGKLVKPAKFCLCSAKQGIVGVARVTSLLWRHSMILEMRGCEMHRIVYPKAFPVRLHNVTAQAKLRAFGLVHLSREARSQAKDWQDKEDQKGHDF